MFPVIKNIDDVLPYIDEENFIVKKGEHFTTINYRLINNETFPDNGSHAAMIRRECRGIKFYPDGKIAARPFHKFFNVNERESTLEQNIDFTDSVMMEKADGSMIHPIIIGDHVRFCTKAGITDVAKQAELFVARQYPDLINKWEIDRYVDITPIFEYVGPNNRIVLDYEKEDLILLAIRNTVTGKYSPRYLVQFLAQIWGVPCIKTYSGRTLREVNDSTSDEGVVIRLNNDDMVKVKSTWYVALHRTKEQISQEHNLFHLVMQEKVDDLIPFLSDTDKTLVTTYALQVAMKVVVAFAEMQETASKYKTPKEFGLSGKASGPLNQFIFALIKGEDSNEVGNRFEKFLLENSQSSKMFKNKIKPWMTAKWKERDLNQ